MIRTTFLGTLALAGLLAACGGEATPSSPAAASKPAAASAPASASAKPAASAAASAKPAASAAASASAKPAASGAASAAAKPAASGAAASGAAGSAAAKPAPSLAAATSVATLKVQDTSLGKVLADGRGMTLYSYEEASSPASKDATKCVTACLGPWPPLLTSDTPTAPAGVTGKLGVITRTDFNVKQVTYNDMPLYFFVQDTAAGDTKGQGSKGFGGNWQVIKVG